MRIASRTDFAEVARLMRPPMSLEELAALVDMPAEDLRAWTEAGLLDPDRRGHFDELDLLRLMAIRHYGALGYTPEALAEAISSGEVEPFLSEYIYAEGQRLSIDQAAEHLGLEPDGWPGCAPLSASPATRSSRGISSFSRPSTSCPGRAALRRHPRGRPYVRRHVAPLGGD